MNNFIRKLLSFALATTLLLTTTVPVLAAESVPSTHPESFSEAVMNEYAERHALAFLRMNNLLDNNV